MGQGWRAKYPKLKKQKLAFFSKNALPLFYSVKFAVSTGK